MDLKVAQRLRTVAAVIACIYLQLLPAEVAGQAAAENQLQYVINEESRASVFVGNVAEDANLRDQVPSDAYGQLTYSILSSSSPQASHFTIGENDGILRVASRIDRDNVTFCYQKVTCEIKLDVAVQPRQYFRIIKVTVMVEDINDNPPLFLESNFQRSIAENTSPGASFTIPTADDPDSPRNGVKRYELVSGSDEFSLKVTNSSDGTMDLHLVLRAEVDREQRELYRVIVAAYDGGVPPNMGTLTADIIIQDVNDNYPVFDNETYDVVVSENVAVNQVIVRVHAKDPDMGLNGQIVYSFSTKTQQRFGELFAIHNASGEITLKQPLRYQDGSSYTLSVTARDRNPESLTTLAKVIIHVEDVNDNPPQITVNSLTSTGSVEIPEGDQPGSLVAHISVEDPDSGAGGEFTCRIDSLKFNTQELYGGIEYKVLTSEYLDREDTDSYDLNFICNDLGNPELTSTAQILVTVLDENDNAPAFTEDTYSAIMKENNDIGEYITTVTATDVDLMKNGEIEYQALGDANSLITVNPETGDIKARISFDYENNQRLEIPIIAVDHGEPPLTGTATLLLSFTDEDDSKPEFIAQQFTFEIEENQPMGTEVGQVTAIDADSVPYNDFTYFLSPTEAAYNSFVLDEQNGKLFTKKSLDRETESNYQFVVKAVSKTLPLRTSATVVNVLVTDMNDHFPYCTFPSIKNNTAFVVKVMEIGEKITYLKCSDDDFGNNKKLNYKFLTNSQEHLFGIDKETGAIFAKSEFKGIKEETFTVMVQISDSAEPPKTIDVTLNLVVNKTMVDSSLVTKSNLTIVVSVAVCSAILVLILIIAIVLVIKRKDRKKKKYVDKKVLVAADVQKPNILVRIPEDQRQSPTSPDSTDAGKGQTYTNGISLNDELKSSSSRPTAPTYPQNQAYSATNYNKVPPTYSHYEAHRSDSYGAHGVASTYNQSYLQAQDHNTPYAAFGVQVDGPYHQQRQNQSFEEGVWPLRNNKDSDSESVHSAPASNSDSGRGSNEDADSSQLHHPQHNNSRDGVILHPQPHWSRHAPPPLPSAGRPPAPPPVPPAPPTRPARHSSYKDTLQLHGRLGQISSHPSNEENRYGGSFREPTSHRNFSNDNPYGNVNYRRDASPSPRVYLQDSYNNGGDNSGNNRLPARDRPVHYITASQV